MSASTAPPLAETPLLVATGISKSFGFRRVLESVDLRLDYGTFAVMMGHNGCGKSTLLQILSGVSTADSGTIWLDPQSYPPKLGAQSVVFVLAHAPRLYPDLTPVENIDFFLCLYARRVSAQAIIAALALSRLEQVAHLPLKTFSYGMTKRVSLALIRLLQPKLLLLDEPYSGLDAQSLEDLNAYLIEFVGAGNTVLAITHQPELCPPTALELFTLQQGRVQHTTADQPTTPQQIRSIFVASNAKCSPQVASHTPR